MKRPDRRSPEAEAYRKLYKTARWQRLRLQQLAAQPLCCMCERQGKVTAATVVDHKRPHRGDEALFFDADGLQSLCKPHHDGAKAAEERSGRVRGCDTDGIPLDPLHSWSEPMGCWKHRHRL